MLSGLPASGKSTRAKEIVAQGNWVRVNRDLLRKMLHSDAQWTGRREDITVRTEKEIAIKALSDNLNVVVDDCNLNPGNKEMWSQLARDSGAEFIHEQVTTPVGECLRRDFSADRTPVGKHVIVNMALQYQKYPKQLFPFIVCDIDGTLADISHRLRHVKHPSDCGLCALSPTSECGFKKDWNSFFDAVYEDAVRWDVVEKLLNALKEGDSFVLVSGRPERCRKDTERWLIDKIYTDPRWGGNDMHATLIMRQNHDKRLDSEVKKDIYEKYLKHYGVSLVIDDRPRVIEVWKALGLNVLDVGNGIDF